MPTLGAGRSIERRCPISRATSDPPSRSRPPIRTRCLGDWAIDFWSLGSMAPPAQLPFYCDLCRKGYARISELEVHETSYDHHHRKRAADLKAANRVDSRRDREAANQGLIRVLGDDCDGSRRKSGSTKTKRAPRSVLDQRHTQEVPSRRTTVERKGKRLDRDRDRTEAITELYGSSSHSRSAESEESRSAKVKTASRSRSPEVMRVKLEEASSTSYRRDLRQEEHHRPEHHRPEIQPSSRHDLASSRVKHESFDYDSRYCDRFGMPSSARTAALGSEITNLAQAPRPPYQ